MNENIRTRYLKLRSQHPAWPAASAYRQAKFVPRPGLNWKYSRHNNSEWKRAGFEQDGFYIVVQAIYDYDDTSSYLNGMFSNKYFNWILQFPIVLMSIALYSTLCRWCCAVELGKAVYAACQKSRAEGTPFKV